MQILITGGTGFIGSVLCQQLHAEGHQVTVLSRRPDSVATRCGGSIKAIDDLKELPAETQVDCIINLAGAPIATKRWSIKRKRQLLSSRLDTTDSLVELVARLQRKPVHMISGSAVGFYGDQGDMEISEESNPHLEFSHELCRRWEQSAQAVTEFGTALTILRIGLVVGPGGGFLKQMLTPFKLGLGGRIGNGKQWMPWIHIDDLLRLISWLIDNPSITGPVNATAPNPATNVEFTQTLAELLGRPAVLPIPQWLLRLLLGEMSGLLLGGQKALPKRALAAGFSFHYVQLKEALGAVIV